MPQSTILFELIDLRTETTKTFRLEDGSYYVAQYDTAIHYPDADGVWQDIDNTLTARGSEISTSNARIKFAKKTAGNDTIFTIHDGNRKLTLALNGAEKTVTAILPVLDDLERALKNMDKMEDLGAVKKGVDLIYQKFVKVLGDQGVKKIDTENADFNIDLHEAIAQVPAPSDEMKGKVIDCVKSGYTLNEKVIRHAQVAVGL